MDGGGGNRGTGTAHTSKHTRARALTYYSRIIYYYIIVGDEDYVDDEELRKTKSTENRATTNNTHTHVRTHAILCIKHCESFNSRTHTHPQSAALLLLQPSAVLIMHDIILPYP